ncbi:MAG: hypothetical protein SFV54_23535 [Bryobacteraceae bacterium]|nr:hypothetical protein [Bryobacteraceae bacterium]
MPRFLHVLTGVHAIGAVVCLVMAVGSLVSADFREGLGVSGGSRIMLRWFGEWTWAFLAGIGVVLGVLAYGSWRVRWWAWPLTLVVYGIGVSGSLWQVSVGIRQGWAAAVVNGAVFVYASTPAVRRAYLGKRTR